MPLSSEASSLPLSLASLGRLALLPLSSISEAQSLLSPGPVLPPSQSSSQVTMVQSTQPKASVCSYARLLDEGYAKPWLQQHQAQIAKAALLDAGQEL